MYQHIDHVHSFICGPELVEFMTLGFGTKSRVGEAMGQEAISLDLTSWARMRRCRRIINTAV